jgi:hypothetical protein
VSQKEYGEPQYKVNNNNPNQITVNPIKNWYAYLIFSIFRPSKIVITPKKRQPKKYGIKEFEYEAPDVEKAIKTIANALNSKSIPSIITKFFGCLKFLIFAPLQILLLLL